MGLARAGERIDGPYSRHVGHLWCVRTRDIPQAGIKPGQYLFHSLPEPQFGGDYG